jgi:hypothetical protein
MVRLAVRNPLVNELVEENAPSRKPQESSNVTFVRRRMMALEIIGQGAQVWIVVVPHEDADLTKDPVVI